MIPLKNKINKKVGFSLAVLFLAAGLFVYAFTAGKKASPVGVSGTLIITLNENGFSPKELKVNQGDTVTFKTSLNSPFWPASDLHPTHSLYPEFDPKRPIGPDQTWQFKFERLGTWAFHDHLFPTHTGVIVVGVPDQEVKSQSIESCNNSDNHAVCWKALIAQTLKDKGVDGAFKVLGQLYNTVPEFARGCHDYTHLIGQAAYADFVSHKEFKYTTEASYCGYGFYHGFMESLLTQSGDLSKATEFCTQLAKTAGTAQQAEVACYHGIGHGTADGSQAGANVDSRSFITPALNLCNALQVNEEKKTFCGSGAYNSLVVAWREGKFPSDTHKEEPYRMCKFDQPAYFTKSCYHQMNLWAYYVADNNFSKAIKYVEKIKDGRFIASAMDGLSSSVAMANASDPSKNDEIISVCKKTTDELRQACLDGLVSGIVEGGVPGKEYQGALNLCSSKLLGQTEKDFCYTKVIQASSAWYAAEKYYEACSHFPEKYKNQCLNYENRPAK